MGKKPFILLAIGVFLIVGAFTFGVSDPTCGRGTTMDPGDVCVNEATGDEQTYEEAKAQQNQEIQIGLPVVGGAIILYGGYTAVTRKRNPNWRTRGAATSPTTQPGQTAGLPATPVADGPGNPPRQPGPGHGQPSDPGAQEPRPGAAD